MFPEEGKSMDPSKKDVGESQNDLTNSRSDRNLLLGQK